MITPEVALIYVKQYFSGLRHYPLHEDGQKCLAMYLGKYAISVAHAIAIAENFHSECPTPQQIHDIAFNENLRAKFLPPEPPLHQKWKDAGYSLDPGFYKRMMAEASYRTRQPGEPREIDLMYKAVAAKLKIRDWSKVSWGAIFATARDLGFPLNANQQDHAARWLASQPKSETRPAVEHLKVGNGGNGDTPRPITQADIESARRKRAAENKGSDDGSDV